MSFLFRIYRLLKHHLYCCALSMQNLKKYFNWKDNCLSEENFHLKKLTFCVKIKIEINEIPVICHFKQTIQAIRNHFKLRTNVAIAELFYSQLSNESTGTLEKNLPKSLAVLTFSCAVLLEWIQYFYLWYFYFSGTID